MKCIFIKSVFLSRVLSIIPIIVAVIPGVGHLCAPNSTRHTVLDMHFFCTGVKCCRSFTS